MKFGVVNKSTILNRFVLHTLQRNITHLAVITRKRNIKLVILKGGGTGKSLNLFTSFISFTMPSFCRQCKISISKLKFKNGVGMWRRKEPPIFQLHLLVFVIEIEASLKMSFDVLNSN